MDAEEAVITAKWIWLAYVAVFFFSFFLNVKWEEREIKRDTRKAIYSKKENKNALKFSSIELQALTQLPLSLRFFRLS